MYTSVLMGESVSLWNNFSYFVVLTFLAMFIEQRDEMRMGLIITWIASEDSGGFGRVAPIRNRQ